MGLVKGLSGIRKRWCPAGLNPWATVISDILK